MSLKATIFTAKASTINADAGRFHRHLLENQQLTPEALGTLQSRLAQDIVRTAMRDSTFYRRTYGELGIDPVALADSGAWAEIPILDRMTIKEHSDEFPTAEATERTARTAVTGGSTGEPLRTMHDARVPALALAWRMYGWWGVQPYDNLARIGRWNFGRMATLKNDVSWWPSRQVYLDAGLLTDDTMTTFHRSMTRIRPPLLEGYIGALLEFADFLERRGLRVPEPLAIASTAAPLTESARTRLENAFGAPVHDEYRSSEIGWMAGECARRDGLHVFADVRRIEVVDADGRPAAPGELGDLVITDLRNRVFPMIRYRTGDRGILRAGPCPCGLSLPLMEPPQGRTNDILHLPSGTALAHRLTAMFGTHPEAVRLFQVHQQADYSLTVRVVEGEEPGARRHIETAVSELRERIRDEVPVRIEYVESLPYTGGKTKYIISDVPTS
ncbi:phenylacetate--CoA ligase family protein [Brachybacterium fresconis]|uniref:Phenylacetate-CoA ligase n=1 Tax=Brachybacterium fresconis TaxID=173363 RepID=A0ABS4YPP5_9MICO|nr:phenylacetate--CoA ligase family protein [Brachybacterium fresconis]MBP2409918.1 phenylacetate-CoA ligase [Brachybacterium fresconis]